MEGTVRQRRILGTLAALAAIGATAVPSASVGNEKRVSGREQIIQNASVTLDRRCHVAVVRVTLSRSAPVGLIVSSPSLQFVGRVPFGPQRGVFLASVRRTHVWDLSLPNGRYLAPGRYRIVVRALNPRRTRVLDRSRRLRLVIPRSFASPPTDCAG
jgi:hypothetical protein